MAYLMQFLFYGIPVLAVVLFVVCLVRYRMAKKKNSQEPGTYSEKEMKQRKLLVAVLGVIAGTFVMIILSFIAMLFLAVAFM